MKKDYYEILGVSKTATAAEIKKPRGIKRPKKNSRRLLRPMKY